MIQVIASDERHHEDHGWLDTRWHFSFADYYDPENEQWGALRVFNDDVVQPGQGFGMHPHRDMEIVTYVLSGSLEHRDSLGHRGVIGPGEVQVMSAGRGIRHSEYNASKTDPLHLLQLWIFPRHNGLEPRWEQRVFPPEERSGRLLPVVSDGAVPGTLAIDQDAGIFIARLAPGQRATHTSRPARKAYAFLISGEAKIAAKKLAAGDQARLANEKEIAVEGVKDAELILLDLPA
ncbi:MAG TPA: pirin family protein [Candidatus Acidoferrales bacterium]|nr:pirin family protein [Candidatus Acidoferrales bacterium]